MNFSILGPLEISGPSGAVQIRGARPMALIATLLLRPDQLVPLSVLVDTLWPDDPPRSAVDNVRTYVSKLRRLLAKAGDIAGRLTSHPGAYRLAVAHDELDLLQFQGLADAADQAIHNGDLNAAARDAGRAVSLWRGRPLLGLDVGPELFAASASVEDRYWATFSAWTSASLALGEHETLVPILREKVAEQSLNEKTWAHLALALHAAGRTGDALAACAEARRTFIDELGIEPGSEVTEVQTAILAGTPLPSTPPRRLTRPRPQLLHQVRPRSQRRIRS